MRPSLRILALALAPSALAIPCGAETNLDAKSVVSLEQQHSGRLTAPSSGLADSTIVASTGSPVAGGGGTTKGAASPANIQPATQSKTGLYLTGALGANWPQNANAVENDIPGLEYSLVESRNSGLSIEAGLGYDFGGVRVEATYAYDRSSLAGYTDSEGSYTYSGGSVNKNSVFASAYWDINLKGRFKPYIGGGVGYSNLRVQDSSDGIAEYNGYNAGGFGYQAKAGVRYVATRSTDLFAEAVYRGMAGYTATDGDFVYHYGGYNSWGFQIGTRIRL